MVLEIDSGMSPRRIVVTARTIKWLSILVLILQITFCCLCSVSMAYCLIHPGYWTNWQYPSVVVFSVAGAASLIDYYQLYRYIFGRAGSSILINDTRNFDSGECSQNAYGLLSLAHMFLLISWVALIAILVATDHGKDFRNAFNDPPVAEWWLCISAACILLFLSGVMSFLCHRERSCMVVHWATSTHSPEITLAEAARARHAARVATRDAARAQAEAEAEAAEATAELIEQTRQDNEGRAERHRRRREERLRYTPDNGRGPSTPARMV